MIIQFGKLKAVKAGFGSRDLSQYDEGIHACSFWSWYIDGISIFLSE